MANLGEHFDANSVEPQAPMEVIPPGKYRAEIVNSEMRPTASGGELLWLELSITEGPHANRRLFDRLNLVNSSEEAVETARRTLSSICHATGRMQVSDSEQLHHIPMLVTVRVRPAGPDKKGIHRETQNEVRGYEAAGSGAVSATRHAAPAASSAPASKPAASPAASTPPWKRSA